MGRHPSAVFHRPVYNLNYPTVGRRDQSSYRFSLSYSGQDFSTIFFGVACNKSGCRMVVEKFTEAGAEPDYLGGQTPDFAISLIIQDESPGRIEHAKTLRHVVERRMEFAFFLQQHFLRPRAAPQHLPHDAKEHEHDDQSNKTAKADQ